MLLPKVSHSSFSSFRPFAALESRYFPLVRLYHLEDVAPSAICLPTQVPSQRGADQSPYEGDKQGEKRADSQQGDGSVGEEAVRHDLERYVCVC